MASPLTQKRSLSRKRELDPAPAIPDRLYFKIGDVARICQVESYVLRFWETQFPQLKPNKSGTGQRLYRRRDVELALKIKQLVHGDGYTLAGARQALEENRQPAALSVAPAPIGRARTRAAKVSPVAAGESMTSPAATEAMAATLTQVRSELRELLGLLSESSPRPATRRRAKVTTLSAPMLFPLAD